MISHTATGAVGEPVIGDIKLGSIASDSPADYYAPMVYFTDGVQPPQWGVFCHDNIGIKEASVICNQLGYELDNFTGLLV